jgi:hypothetical protein
MNQDPSLPVPTHNLHSCDAKPLEELVAEAIARGMARAFEARGMDSKKIVFGPGFLEDVRGMIAEEGGYLDPVLIEEAFADPDYVGPEGDGSDTGA